MNDILSEFLVETSENLAQLDLDLVALEKQPGERETLARVFRTLHTVKGTAGFLGLAKLQAVAHAGENLLGQLRAGELAFKPEIATALLGVVDAIREILRSLEATEQEGSGEYADLIRTLERLTRRSSEAAPRVPIPETPAVVVGPQRVAAPTPVPPVSSPPSSPRRRRFRSSARKCPRHAPRPWRTPASAWTWGCSTS